MHLSFKPITKTFGAEVVGYDPDGHIDDDTKDQLLKAFDDYDLLLLRDLQLNAAQQADFAHIFGRPAPQTLVAPGSPAAAEPETQYVSNTRSDGIIPNGDMAYHMDHVFDAEPVRILMLYGVEVPGEGGGTKFRSCADIYERLDDRLKDKAEAVRCLHLFDPFNPALKVEPGRPAPWDEETEDGRSVFSLENASPMALKAWHPLVWRNPRSQKKAAWAIRAVVDFEGISKDEGRALVSQMWEDAKQQNEYVHNWRTGDLVLWNNLMLQHGRTPFKPTEKRTLRRSQLL